MYDKYTSKSWAHDDDEEEEDEEEILLCDSLKDVNIHND